MSSWTSIDLSPYNKRAVSSSFLKGLDLLTLLARSPGGMKMPALSRRMKMPRTSILRMLATAELFGLAARKDKTWRTTPRFHDWCSRDMHGEIRKRYGDAVRKVAAKVNELVELGVAEGDGIRFIDYSQSSHLVVVDPLKTSLYPLHKSASGKLILSQRPDLCEAIRDRRLLEEIAEARGTGVGWNHRETDPNVIAMATWAAPPSGLAPMIAVIWPVFRFTESAAHRALGIIRETLRR